MNDILRRILMLAGIGRITSAADHGGVQKLQVQTPLDVRNDTLRFSEYGFSSNLPIGTDVVVLSLGGDRSSQVIVASNHNTFRIEGLNSGEVAIYDQWGKYLKLGEDDIEVFANDRPVKIKNATVVTIEASEQLKIDSPTVRITGNLEVEGNITDLCTTNTNTVGYMRDQYNQHTHDVQGVQTGGSTVTTQNTEQKA